MPDCKGKESRQNERVGRGRERCEIGVECVLGSIAWSRVGSKVD
jgi:hypothetical protein